MSPLPFPVRHELFPVERRFLELDGTRIDYVDEGAGDTRLLLHGNLSWSSLYRKIIAGLKDAYRCVALDFPGHGISGAPAAYSYTPLDHSEMLEQFVDRLAPSDLTIMVQGLGRPDRARLRRAPPRACTSSPIGQQ
jgi:haloalkane dehalogenase